MTYVTFTLYCPAFVRLAGVLSVAWSQEMLNVDEFKCNPFAARIVELFSEDGSGVISFQKFINIFSVFSPRATAETKSVWAFAVWDFDGAHTATAFLKAHSHHGNVTKPLR